MSDPTSLQNLHPLVMPPDAGLFPLAPGWYVVTLVVLVFIARGMVKAILRWKAAWYRREGLQRLANLRRQYDEGNTQVLQELPVLLKAAALTAYPRPMVASLSGEAWRTFLNATVEGDLFSVNQGRLLQDISCLPTDMLQGFSSGEIDGLLGSATTWLQRHDVKKIEDISRGQAQ